MHQLLLKLRLAAKDKYEKNLRNRVESHEQASKLLAKFEDFNDRRTRASMILFSLAEATFNYRQQLPESVSSNIYFSKTKNAGILDFKSF